MPKGTQKEIHTNIMAVAFATDLDKIHKAICTVCNKRQKKLLVALSTVNQAEGILLKNFITLRHLDSVVTFMNTFNILFSTCAFRFPYITLIPVGRGRNKFWFYYCKNIFLYENEIKLVQNSKCFNQIKIALKGITTDFIHKPLC